MKQARMHDSDRVPALIHSFIQTTAQCWVLARLPWRRVSKAEHTPAVTELTFYWGRTTMLRNGSLQTVRSAMK